VASSVIGGHARRGRSPLRSFAGRSHCTWDTEPVRTRLPAVVTRAVRNSHRDVVAALATRVLDACPVDDDQGDHRSHDSRSRLRPFRSRTGRTITLRDGASPHRASIHPRLLAPRVTRASTHSPRRAARRAPA